MVNVIVSLFSVAIVLVGIGFFSQSGFSSIQQLTEAWNKLENRQNERAQTNLQFLSTSSSAGQVDLTLKNTGQEPIRDFDSWDLVVDYFDSAGKRWSLWLPYTATNPPGADQWTVTGIYMTADTKSEVFQPNILDPEEEMVIEFALSSTLAGGSASHKVLVGTPNGITASSFFSAP
ncbi:MAG: hypothetical protein O2913_08470 [Chloroflexi bacterium]|nr:hypothetical protein [Chloroflexota bacterium]